MVFHLGAPRDIILYNWFLETRDLPGVALVIKFSCKVFFCQTATTATADNRQTSDSFPRKFEGLVELKGTYQHPSRLAETSGMQLILVMSAEFTNTPDNHKAKGSFI